MTKMLLPDTCSLNKHFCDSVCVVLGLGVTWHVSGGTSIKSHKPSEHHTVKKCICVLPNGWTLTVLLSIC